MYVNVNNLSIFSNNEIILIELKLQKYMDEIELLDENATLLYTQILINIYWEYYYFGLNSIDGPMGN
jgi:hypothetical protein